MIMLFASEEGIDLDYKVVDLSTGEHTKPDDAAINPNCRFQRSMTATSG
jgi:glutathione S-transferase